MDIEEISQTLYKKKPDIETIPADFYLEAENTSGSLRRYWED